MSEERNFVVCGPREVELRVAEERKRELFFRIVHESGQMTKEFEVSACSIRTMSDGSFCIDGTINVEDGPLEIVIEKYDPENGSGISWFPSEP